MPVRSDTEEARGTFTDVPRVQRWSNCPQVSCQKAWCQQLGDVKESRPLWSLILESVSGRRSARHYTTVSKGKAIGDVDYHLHNVYPFSITN